MAQPGETTEHLVTGARITFLRATAETGGAFTRYELAVSPAGFVAAPHLHPQQVERFKVVAGTFGVVLDGEAERRGYRLPHPYARLHERELLTA